MTKNLYIVRHAESSWKYDNVYDYDRPLKNSGITEAYQLASRLAKLPLPDKIISSPANRAIHTAIICARSIHFPFQEIVMNDLIYNAEARGILEWVRQIDDNIKTLMVVGHNPVLTDLINYFLPEPLDNLPTAGIAALSFKAAHWMAINANNVEVYYITNPKKAQ